MNQNPLNQPTLKSLARLVTKYRSVVALAYVIWRARFRSVSDGYISRVVEILDREVAKQERRGRIQFTERYPRPGRRTLGRIFDMIRHGWYELTPSLEREIARFQGAYDRLATYRMDQMQVDCKKLSGAWLASQGIDHIAIDESGKEVEVVVMNAIDRVTTVCPGMRAYPWPPKAIDTMGFLKDVMLGRLAPELGRIGIAKQVRVDNGPENGHTVLVPRFEMIGCDLQYGRPYRPHDKPLIESFNHTIWSFFHLQPEDICTMTGPDGVARKYITLEVLVKRLTEARIAYNRARPQRPRKSPIRLEKWYATLDPISDSRFDPLAICSHLYIEAKLRVIGQTVVFDGHLYRHPDFEPYPHLRVCVFPEFPGRVLQFLTPEGDCVCEVREAAP